MKSGSRGPDISCSFQQTGVFPLEKTFNRELPQN